jgi:hypothetical protein
MDLYKIVNKKLFSNNDLITDKTKDRPDLSSERPPHSGKQARTAKQLLRTEKFVNRFHKSCGELYLANLKLNTA